MTQRNGTRLPLDGLDGSNPLAYLAALGTLRTLSAVDDEACMGWEERAGAWRPVVWTTAADAADRLVEVLHLHLKGREGRPEFDLDMNADNLSVAPAEFGTFARKAAETASAEERATADFAVAYASDAVVDRPGKNERVADTAFRTMSGSGWQHFLGSMRNIIAATGPDHLRKTLSETWRYDDPLEKRSMRWEPTEDRRHAYQWVDPSTDSSRSKRGSMLGANRLAIEALPFFPTAPVGGRLATTGFRANRSRVEWTWPIWAPPAPRDAVASLVALRDLQFLDDAEEAKRQKKRARLREMGIVEVFRSTRIAAGYFRNFSPARAI